MNSTVITFAGHLAEAPELRFTPAGRPAAKVRVAVNSRYQNSDGALGAYGSEGPGSSASSALRRAT